MFQEITQTAGRLDILVNNAGIAHSSPVETLALSDFQRVMNVHVVGTFLCSKAAIQMMYAQERGCIINTASQLAYIGAPAFSHYTAAKGAILSFTRSLALEVGSRNVPVNAVAPGATMTPILEDVPNEVLDVIKANIPREKLLMLRISWVPTFSWPVMLHATSAGNALAPMAGTLCSSQAYLFALCCADCPTACTRS